MALGQNFGFFHNYPYSDLHELNLDWILNEIRTLHSDWNEFQVVNAIRFEGEWNITKGYQKWSLVNLNGSGYISIQPVPVGVSIENEDYWRLVANYSELFADLQNRVVALEELTSTHNVEINNINATVAHFKNVKNYGAVGDGVIDDTESIVNAYNDCVDGDILYLPVGTYLFDGSITITKNIKIIGDGIENTILIKPTNATTTNFLSFIGTSSNIVKGIRFNGNGQTQTTNLYAILGFKASNLIIDNVYIEHQNGIAIGFSNCYMCTVENSKIDYTYTLNCGIWMDYDEDVLHGYHHIINNKITNCELDGIIADEDYVTIKDCIILNCGIGTPASALGACGIFADGRKNIKNLIIENCVTSNNSESGINIEYGFGVKISKCTSMLNGLAGIVGKFIRSTITSCECYSNGNNPTTEYPDKWFKSGIACVDGFGVSLIGNSCYDNRPTSTQDYGIRWQIIDGASNVCVIGNNLKYNKLDDSNIGSSYPATVITNLIYDGLNA